MRFAKHLLGCLLLAASVSLVGCGSQAGRTVLTQGANAEPVMSSAPDTAKYMLYTAFSPNPTATVRLNAGEPLGFRRDNGKLVAVAGSQTFDLPSGTSQAYWKEEAK